MNKVTNILLKLQAGDLQAASELIPLVYDELRRLAESRLRREKHGTTLQATALVHDAYLRLVDTDQMQGWESRGHFFACAAEAMRRILIENARRRKALRRGGDFSQVDLNSAVLAVDTEPDRMLSLNDAIEKLETFDASAAGIARLRLFAGLTTEDAAMSLGLSRSVGFREWTYARAFLQAEMES
ncbi:MAG: RNA polymerase subunit sigma [Planctomycetaceae bacterium]|nr:RNA polymerase subunit sigma [Planctomycetaceae bacterium]